MTGTLIPFLVFFYIFLKRKLKINKKAAATSTKEVTATFQLVEKASN
jgi:hypothetical protein